MYYNLIPNATYGEFLPRGEFAALRPGVDISTHAGSVTLPDEDVLFIRATNEPIFKFAGQGSRTGIAWEWDGTWHNKGTTFGVSPIIYDNDGNLLFATSEEGSQGFRYIDSNGFPITGDATYKHPAKPLWEYTEVMPNVFIGQSSIGCTIWADPMPISKNLSVGDTRFIRANSDGKSIAVYIANFGKNIGELFLFNLRELFYPRALR